MTIKCNQKTLLYQFQCPFQGKRLIPFAAVAQGYKHSWVTLWERQINSSPEHIKENLPGVSCIIEMTSNTVTGRGKQLLRAHYFLTSLRTKPEALLRLIRQRSSIENEWHRPWDTQLSEDKHCHANRNGAPLFAFLRTCCRRVFCPKATTAQCTRASNPLSIYQGDACTGRPDSRHG
jgi:hypothetical protein